MPAFRIRSLVRGLFRRSRIEHDMHEELQSHIQRYADDLMWGGLPREEAFRRACAEFGGLEATKENCRDVIGISFLDELRRNVQFGFRMLRKSSSFSFIAILSLAVGIALNTTAFSLVSLILFHPLPVAGPEKLVFLDTTNPPWLSVPAMSYPDYKDLRHENVVLSDLVAYRIAPMNMSNGTDPSVRLWGFLASGNYFEALGVSAILGRTFTPSDDLVPGGHPVAVLSHFSWQKRFGGDPAVVGRTVKINGMDFTILGVMPASFNGTEVWLQPELWVPMMMQPQIERGNPWLDQRGTWNCWVLGRLKNGVTPAQAEAQLQAIATHLSVAHGRPDTLRIRLVPPGLVGTWLRKSLLGIAGLLFAATALVLFAACVNIASLLLARGSDRSKEVAVRLALGARRTQIIRQLLTESLLISLLGGALGGLLANWMIQVISRFPLPGRGEFPYRTELAVDHRVFAFGVFVCVFTTILFGVLPALQSSRIQVLSSLKQESKFRIRQWELRDVLVTGQIALCVLLLSGSAIVFRSLQQALHLNLGFNPRGVVSISFDLGLEGYDPQRGRQFQLDVLQRLQSLNGVQSAGLINALPLTTDQSSTCIGVEGQPQRATNCVNYYHAAPNYFRTMQTRIVSGRDFEMSDGAESKPVAIVNRALARSVFGTEEVLGKRIGAPGRWREIVGVVEDGRYISLGDDSKAVLFFPLFQRYNSTTAVVVRSKLAEKDTLDLVRNELLRLNPNLTLFQAGGVEGHLQLPLAPVRIAAAALSASGALAIFLAATGIYGVMRYAVARQTREIGIRIAVGATSADISRLVAARGGRALLAGTLAGVGLTLLTGAYLSSILYGVRPRDPLVFALVIALISLVVTVACWVPVRLATRIDPIIALRSE